MMTIDWSTFYKGLRISLMATILASCQGNNSGINPQYRPITEAVYASGYIMPQNDYTLHSRHDGYLVSVKVEEGSKIRSGEVLFVIDSDEQDEMLQNARENYVQARRNYDENSPVLQELNLNIESARIQMVNDSITYDRYVKLWANNATSKEKLDQSKLKYEQSLQNYQVCQSRYDKTKDQLYLQLKSAESQYNIYKDQRSDFELKSRVDGKIYDIYKEKGELVTRNEPMALIGDDDQFYLQLEVDEMDISKIDLKQRVVAKIDAFPDKIYEARVQKIYPMLNRQDQSFRIDAHFINKPPLNLGGISVEANIIISQKEKALTIPRSYIIGRDTVIIRNNGENKKVRIEKGLENMQWVEVKSPLDTLTMVYLP